MCGHFFLMHCIRKATTDFEILFALLRICPDYSTSLGQLVVSNAIEQVMNFCPCTLTLHLNCIKFFMIMGYFILFLNKTFFLPSSEECWRLDSPFGPGLMAVKWLHPSCEQSSVFIHHCDEGKQGGNPINRVIPRLIRYAFMHLTNTYFHKLLTYIICMYA